jgi:hypothetical protein
LFWNNASALLNPQLSSDEIERLVKRMVDLSSQVSVSEKGLSELSLQSSLIDSERELLNVKEKMSVVLLGDSGLIIGKLKGCLFVCLFVCLFCLFCLFSLFCFVCFVCF